MVGDDKVVVDEWCTCESGTRGIDNVIDDVFNVFVSSYVHLYNHTKTSTSIYEFYNVKI